jgi:hypothetical protein
MSRGGKRGYKHTDEAKAKISAATKGNPGNAKERPPEYAWARTAFSEYTYKAIIGNREELAAALQTVQNVNFEWQKHVLDMINETSPVYIVVPRQNGKTKLLIDYVLQQLFMFNKKIIFVSSSRETAHSFFMKISNHVFSKKVMASRVDRCMNSMGREFIKTKDGGEFAVRSTSERSAVGFTAEILVFDECQFLKSETVAAVLPALTTNEIINGEVIERNQKTIYAGTTPKPQYSFFYDAFKQNHGKDNFIFYGLLKTPKKPATWATVEKMLAETNPSYQYGLINAEEVRRHWEQMPWIDFCREHLGLFENIENVGIFNADKIKQDMLLDDRFRFDAYAVGINADAGQVAVAIAQKLDDGCFAVQVIDHGGIMEINPADWLEDKRGIVGLLVSGFSQYRIFDDLKKKFGNIAKLAKMNNVLNANDIFLESHKNGKIKYSAQDDVIDMLSSVIKSDRKRGGGFEYVMADEKATDKTPVRVANAIGLAILSANYAPITKPQRRL